LFEYVIEYADKVCETYKDFPKLLEFNFVEAHESLGENIKIMDNYITNYLQSLLKGDHNTTILRNSYKR
jgi:hypothetical protein